MTNSLKSLLYNLIAEKGEVSYGEMCQFTVEEGYKASTAERRLRELMSPENSPIQGLKKLSKRNTPYIYAYKYSPPAPPKPSFRVLTSQEVEAQYAKLNL